MGQGNLDKLAKGLTANRQTPIAPQGSPSVMPLDSIKPRPHAQTRAANPTHVSALAESIAAVGLISPIAVDGQGVLLAGLHRLDAIKAIQTTNPRRFGELFSAGVPVRRFDFDATTDPSQALIVEATENEQRRDYTPEEVRHLADRLVAAGYRNLPGKPRAGQKALTPALSVIIGKSTRTIERYLAKDQQATEKPTEGGVTPIWIKRRSTLSKWRVDAIQQPNGNELVEAIDRLLELLRDVDRP